MSKTPATAEEQQYICRMLANEMLGLCLTDVMSKIITDRQPGDVMSKITVPAVPKALWKVKEASQAFKEAADAEEAKAKAAGEEKPAAGEEKPAEVGAEEGGGGGGDGLMGMAKGLFGKAKDMGEELLGDMKDMTHYALAKVLRGAAAEMDKVHETFEKKSTMEAIGKKVAFSQKAKFEEAFKEQLKDSELPDAFLVCTERRVTDAVLTEQLCVKLVNALKTNDDIQKKIKDELLGKDSTTQRMWDETQADYKRIVMMIDSLQVTGMKKCVPTLDIDLDIPEHVCSGIVGSLVKLLGEREVEIRQLPLNKGSYPDIFEKVFKQEKNPEGKDKLLRTDYKVMGGLHEK